MVFSQNHDQIANASHGQRHSTLLDSTDEKLALSALIAAPSSLLLFQGQEYGETAPFFYFTSHGDADLVEAVRSGRKAELVAFGLAEHYRDPQDPETFRACVLEPSRVEQAPHAQMLALTKDLLALRKRVAALSNARRDLLTVEYDEAQRTLGILRRDPNGSAALVTLCFAHQAASCPLPARSVPFELALFTRSAAYGHDAAVIPADVIAPTSPSLMLPPRSAAIYLAGPVAAKAD
jgi:maltooligosyltrehalose trehalohydrolase